MRMRARGGVGEATAHRPVASADGLARRGGHGAVEAVAVGVRAGRFRWPAMKKCSEKKRLEKARGATENCYPHLWSFSAGGPNQPTNPPGLL